MNNTLTVFPHPEIAGSRLQVRGRVDSQVKWINNRQVIKTNRPHSDFSQLDNNCSKRLQIIKE